MKEMIRIGAAVCVLAFFTSFTIPQEDAQVEVEKSATDAVACL
jgi:hypothetical protein